MLVTYIGSMVDGYHPLPEDYMITPSNIKHSMKSPHSSPVINYKALKSKFNHLPALYHPLPEDYMIIETDASDLYWGGILKARNLNNEEKLCRYASGTFTGPETRYHSNEKEYLAIKKTIKKFKAYIIDKEFSIRTDSKNFRYFLRTNISEDYKQGRLLRWQQWFN